MRFKKNRIINRKIIRRDEKATLCWICKNACGKCAWSSDFKEVEGWEVEATMLSLSNNMYTNSYLVKKCPLFEYDGKCSTCVYFSDAVKTPEEFYLTCPEFSGYISSHCDNYKKRNDKNG